MSALTPLPHQAENISWPTIRWPENPTSKQFDHEALEALLEEVFSPESKATYGETHAFLAARCGEIVSERYAGDFNSETTFPSWSKAKSITHALIGILVRDGLIDINQPADVPEWQHAGDARAAITLDQLLRMSSGLKFAEDYVDAGISDVIEMLFGKGSEDVAAFAAAFPLDHTPGEHWSYASGTSNIVSRLVSQALNKSGENFQTWMFDELFTPIGMTSAAPKLDTAGTFIGSSFCYATARDFARFGLLYLRDGVWDGKRILPEGWVDYARRPTPTPPEEPMGYGAHWWLGIAGPDSFSANGYQGQYTVCIPSLDLIIVRHGNSEAGDEGDAVRAWIARVADCFRA